MYNAGTSAAQSRGIAIVATNEASAPPHKNPPSPPSLLPPPSTSATTDADRHTSGASGGGASSVSSYGPCSEARTRCRASTADATPAAASLAASWAARPPSRTVTDNAAEAPSVATLVVHAE